MQPAGADSRHLGLKALAVWLAGLLLPGCWGLATRNEEAARRDIRVTRQAYRPKDAKPALPALTAASSLSDLIHYALLNSPGVEAAFYDWKGTVETITTARSLPDPMLNFNAEIVGDLRALTPILMTDPMSNWPGPGKLPLRAEAAYQQAVGKRAVFEGELLAAALAVKRAYYQMWVLEQQVLFARRSLELVEDMESLAMERMAVGKVTEQDVLRAQMEKDRLKNQLANLQDFRKPVTARLRSALGIGPKEAMPELAFRLDDNQQEFTEQSLLDVAYARNPRLKEMRSEVQQAIALYQLAQKSTVPDYSFGLGVNVKASPAPLMPMAGITLPMWRDKIAAEIARDRAGVQAAKAKLSKEELDLAVRFAETAFTWREADRNVKLYGKRLIPKAEASVDCARAGYVVGISGFLDLLEAEKTLLDYRLDHAEAAGRREIALAEMSLMILGRWPENVAAILPPSAPNAGNVVRQEGGSEQ